MRYSEFLERAEFSRDELLAFGERTLISDAPLGMGALPMPPLLMFDRVLRLERNGGRGRLVAEFDVQPDAWYFQCHFKNDPVQPGCLGVDGVWQLIGLFLWASGCPGAGRALGCGAIEFNGQVRPFHRVVRYDVEIRRLTRLAKTGCGLAIADAVVSVDGKPIYTINGARVGTFLEIGAQS